MSSAWVANCCSGVAADLGFVSVQIAKCYGSAIAGVLCLELLGCGDGAGQFGEVVGRVGSVRLLRSAEQVVKAGLGWCVIPVTTFPLACQHLQAKPFPARISLRVL